MYSPATRKVFIDAYKKLHGHIGQACDIAGISRGTYTDWRRDDKDFREAIEAVEESFLDSAEACIRAHIEENDDQQAAMFLLRTIGKRRGYTQADQVQHSLSTAPVINFLVAAPEQKTIDVQATEVPPGETTSDNH